MSFQVLFTGFKMTAENAVVGTTPTDASSPVGSSPKHERKMTTREHWMVSIGCAILGVMALLPFQFLCVILPVLLNHFLDGWQLGNSMLGLCQFLCLVALVVILKIGSLHKWLVQGALAVSLVGMALFPPAFFYGSLTTRAVLVHIIMAFLGACNGALLAAGFARAAILPGNYVAVTSIGHATSGLIAFVVTAIMMNCVHDMSVKDDVMWLTIICCGLNVICCALSIAYMRVFLNAKVCVQSVNNALNGGGSGKGQQEDAPTLSGDIEDMGRQQTSGLQNEALLPPRPWLIMIKGSFWELLSVFLVFFVTFNLFPKVGPVSFNFQDKCPAKIVLFFGMQFIGDFVGRCILPLSNACRMFRFFFLSRNATIAASFLRICFYIPFILAMKMENVPFVNNFAWLMILQFLLAVTLGWVAALSQVYCSQSVVRASEKVRISSLLSIIIAVAISAGLYVAIAY